MAYTFSEVVQRVPGHHNTPTYDISRDQLVSLYNDFGSWSDVALYLNVSRMTINRYVKKFDIKLKTVAI